MPGKARPGKQKTRSAAKKRVKVTASGKFRMQKAAHNHRLNPKNKRQLTEGGRLITVPKGEAKKLKAMM